MDSTWPERSKTLPSYLQQLQSLDRHQWQIMIMGRGWGKRYRYELEVSGKIESLKAQLKSFVGEASMEEIYQEIVRESEQQLRPNHLYILEELSNAITLRKHKEKPKNTGLFHVL